MFKIKKYVLAILMLIIGLSLIFANDLKNYIVKSKQDNISVTKISKKQIKKNNKKKGDFDYSQVRVISAEDVLKSQINGVALNPIGGISIPDLGVNLPILKGTTNENLLYGAATLKEQEMGKGNYTLASHHVFRGAGSDSLLFSPIVNAKEGMKVYLTDKQNIYTYVVYNIEIVAPTRLDVLDDIPNENIVTLITCTDAQALQRTVVRGRLEKISSWSNSSKEQSYFGGTKNNEAK